MHKTKNLVLKTDLSVYDQIYRVNKSCDGLENQPLRVHFQGVLMRPLDAVKDLLLVAVHGGILQNKYQACVK